MDTVNETIVVVLAEQLGAVHKVNVVIPARPQLLDQASRSTVGGSGFDGLSGNRR